MIKRFTHENSKSTLLIQIFVEKNSISQIFLLFLPHCGGTEGGGRIEGEHHLEKLDDDVVWTPSNWTTLGHNILLVATKSFYSCYCYTHSKNDGSIVVVLYNDSFYKSRGRSIRNLMEFFELKYVQK